LVAIFSAPDRRRSFRCLRRFAPNELLSASTTPTESYDFDILRHRREKVIPYKPLLDEAIKIAAHNGKCVIIASSGAGGLTARAIWIGTL